MMLHSVWWHQMGGNGLVWPNHGGCSPNPRKVANAREAISKPVAIHPYRFTLCGPLELSLAVSPRPARRGRAGGRAGVPGAQLGLLDRAHAVVTAAGARLLVVIIPTRRVREEPLGRIERGVADWAAGIGYAVQGAIFELGRLP